MLSRGQAPRRKGLVLTYRIRHHHERLDGSGYPDRLRGEEVPLLAQIIGVVDVYDAVTTPRPYQQTLTAKQAIRILRDQVDRGWRQ